MSIGAAIEETMNGTGSGSKSKQENVGDKMAHLKNTIKKQVIKFYQNNLVHENSYTRSRGIECKG